MAGINHKLFHEAKKYLAGGVNSPIRSFKLVGNEPLFISRAKGSKIYDANGKSYIDYCLGFGALILGHAHQEIIKAVRESLNRGTIYGLPTSSETELAKRIIQAVPSIQKLRLVNSGTEACMSAVRLARAFTKKNKLIKFRGNFHGSSDSLLAGISEGLPDGLINDVITLDYNNLNSVKMAFKNNPDNIAAVIVEPVSGNVGVVRAKKLFLDGLRWLCDKYKSLLIFDEVITGFRFHFGTFQELAQIKADLTCLGKIIGGGFPLAAFGGRKKIMQRLSPEGNVYQAGTFSGNPVSVTAGLTALNILSKNNCYQDLERKTAYLCQGIEDSAKKHKIKIKINRLGSMFSIFFSNKSHFKRFFLKLLKKGVFIAPSPYEACFLSLAHSHQDIAETIKAVDFAFRDL